LIFQVIDRELNVFSESPMKLPDLGFSCGVLEDLSFIMYNAVLPDEWFPVFQMLVVLVKYQDPLTQ
jgi:hypothetical protein